MAKVKARLTHIDMMFPLVIIFGAALCSIGKLDWWTLVIVALSKIQLIINRR